MKGYISKRRRKARVLKVLTPFYAQIGGQRLKETLEAILISDLLTIKLPKVRQKYIRFEQCGAISSGILKADSI